MEEGATLVLLVQGDGAQQILGEQDADHLVAVLADDGVTRVAGVKHLAQEGVERRVLLQHGHLSARDHDVAGA